MDIDSIDFFGDESLVEDPYPYFEELRAASPVLPLPHLGIVAVTAAFIMVINVLVDASYGFFNPKLRV